MQSIKTFAAAALLTLSATTVADAQRGRPFSDSWFWGIKTGALTYTSTTSATATVPGNVSVAPFVGADWLITRTQGGLYVAFSQAFVTTTGAILNGPTAADSGYRDVNLSGLRRLDFIALAFPGSFVRWHPYVGGGVAFRYIANADPVGPFASPTQSDYAISAANDVKASIGPAFMLGAQFRLKWISAFAQGTVSTTGRDYLLANGYNATFSAEFGFRYNLSTSVDR